MKQHPIPFSAPLVRAIRAGIKTQTRRVVKSKLVPIVEECFKVNGKWCNHTFGYELGELCPYGVPGDQLWVRETWRTINDPATCIGDALDIDYRANGEERIGDRIGTLKWKPSIFMPRWASRINLEVTGVRVERVQDISEEDAIAEGVYSRCVQAAPPLHIVTRFVAPGVLHSNCYGDKDTEAAAYTSAREAYECLWDSINGKTYPWDSNPWVWVITFKKL